MLNWKVFFLVLLVSFVAACNSGKKAFVPVEPESSIDKELTPTDKELIEKGSVVYVYRPARMANVMLSPDISIAGVDKITMVNGSYKRVYLSPGVYAVRLQAIEGVTEQVEHDLEIIKGQIHYLRVDASMKVDAGQQSYQPYKRKFELKNVPAKKAKLEMDSCTNLDVANKRKQTNSSKGGNANEDDAGFSVDKTQNPFSH
jgi:hypothetical protein